jgi:hypothetical protein
MLTQSWFLYVPLAIKYLLFVLLLTFHVQASLFSAILTAFIIEVYKGLQKDDPVATSAQLLLRITMQLDNSTQHPIPLPGGISPSATIIAVNMLWFSGLILSLFTALVGILVKQWLHVYAKWPEREKPKDTVKLRHMYQEGFFRWYVPEIIGLLPVLLQIALLLFAVGLVTYMWTLNSAIAGVLTVLVLAMIILAIASIALPFFWADCPYKSPIGLVIAALKAKYIDKSEDTDLYSWQRRDLNNTRRTMQEDLQSDLVVQSGLVLDLAPRRDLIIEMKHAQSVISHDSLLGSRISGLSRGMLRLLIDLILLTQNNSDKYVVNQHTHYALRILEYIFKHPKRDIRERTSQAVIHIANLFIGYQNLELDPVWRVVQRDSKHSQPGK